MNTEQARVYRKEHPQEVAAARAKNRAKTPLSVHLYRNAKYRAAKNGLVFSIQVSDIKISSTCPVLGIPLTRNKSKGWCDSSPTLDRKDSSLGYVPGNIRVVSWRANKLKSDGTLREFERIVEYLRRDDAERQDSEIVVRSN
jgi:hypothetical protein